MSGMDTGMETFWNVRVTVLVPHSDAPSLDDAIDLVGDKLRPLTWSGRIKEEKEEDVQPDHHAAPGGAARQR